MHPLGKAPVITDGDRVVAESGAILEYLVGRYDRNRLLTPLDEEEALECRYWLHYAEGSLMPLVVMRLIFSRMGKPPVPWLLRPIGAAFGNGVRKGFLDKQLTTHRQFIEQHLTRLPWFAGQHLTLADIQMTFPIQGLAARGGLDGMPATQARLDKISRRPPGSGRFSRVAN